MSVDTREAILQRLVAIVTTLKSRGLLAANRNELDIPDPQLPAMTVLDGDEASLDSQDGNARQGLRPRAMIMRPQIRIWSGASAASIGTDLNRWRALLVPLVLGDTELIALTGANGAINYHGCETDLALGRDMLGRMALVFS